MKKATNNSTGDLTTQHDQPNPTGVKLFTKNKEEKPYPLSHFHTGLYVAKIAEELDKLEVKEHFDFGGKRYTRIQ
jgi:hypothetical protein